MKVLGLFFTCLLVAGCSEKQAYKQPSNFQTDKLIAWCIVPFDQLERSPLERAAMLKRLGIQRVAYDWREKHVAEFEEELLAYQANDIEYFAFWRGHPDAFALFEKYELRPQIWQTLTSPKSGTQEERVVIAGTQMLPLVEKTHAMGLKLGLYNHGGWGGEPENMIAVIEWLRTETDADHVGIVYNLHHGHEHIDRFDSLLDKLLPYLLCLNLNGTNSKPVPKILELGKGEHDVALMNRILKSGYSGPVGILGHKAEDDVERVLQSNLDGLETLLLEASH